MASPIPADAEPSDDEEDADEFPVSVGVTTRLAPYWRICAVICAGTTKAHHHEAEQRRRAHQGGDHGHQRP